MHERIHGFGSLLVLSLLAWGGSAPRGDERAAHAGPAPAAQTAPTASVAALAWLAGDWEGDAWGGRFHAHYTSPEGGRVLSYSRLVRDGRDAYYEFEVFEERAGGVHLQPFPEGKRVDGFELREHDATARRATFENPAKDWPTRVVYERSADDRLVITLSDPHGGGDKVEVFDLGRAR